MEDKIFHNQIVFIKVGAECAPSDCGIFSVTDNLETGIYRKQLIQREERNIYLHSINKRAGEPDIDYESMIDIYCVGKILL